MHEAPHVQKFADHHRGRCGTAMWRPAMNPRTRSPTASTCTPAASGSATCESTRSPTPRAGPAPSSMSPASSTNPDRPLVLAGNHGDEYAGPLAAMRLLQELQPDHVRGRVIVIPVLSSPASRANTRTRPSGANFSRTFPSLATLARIDIGFK